MSPQQIKKRFDVCDSTCVYYKYAIDPCAHHGKGNHSVTAKPVLVGLHCPKHSVSARAYQEERSRFRRAHVYVFEPSEEKPVLDPRVPIENQGKISRDSDSEIKDDGLDAVSATESADGSSRCGSDHSEAVRWAEFLIRQVFFHKNQPQKDTHDVDQVVHLSAVIDGARNQDVHEEIRSTSSYLKRILQTLQLPGPILDGLYNQSVPLQRLHRAQVSNSTPESATLAETISQGTPHPDYRNRSNAVSSFATKRRYCLRIRPCYSLIALGGLTVAGSLVSALWRAKASHDLSGGFAMAHYILGVGVFVVGSVTVIHGRTCTCWQTLSTQRPGID